MYNKELETDKKVREQTTANLKKASAERRAKQAAYTKSHKPSKE